MKLGAEDYLVKEEISTPVLPRTLLSVLERKRLRDELTALEISRKRLETIQDLVVLITKEMRVPLEEMRTHAEELLQSHTTDPLKTYVTIIRDNVVRIESKISRLKSLKTDRTVPYVRDIRMLDLSEGGEG
jgi:signal transduction histidine kinase